MTSPTARSATGTGSSVHRRREGTFIYYDVAADEHLRPLLTDALFGREAHASD
ncbi:MAG: hypothetical protein ACRDRG_09720 [Pseudonocardiaceae bacterium]